MQFLDFKKITTNSFVDFSKNFFVLTVTMTSLQMACAADDTYITAASAVRMNDSNY